MEEMPGLIAGIHLSSLHHVVFESNSVFGSIGETFDNWALTRFKIVGLSAWDLSRDHFCRAFQLVVFGTACH
jgi:hypothetical protein